MAKLSLFLSLSLYLSRSRLHFTLAYKYNLLSFYFRELRSQLSWPPYSIPSPFLALIFFPNLHFLLPSLLLPLRFHLPTGDPTSGYRRLEVSRFGPSNPSLRCLVFLDLFVVGGLYARRRKLLLKVRIAVSRVIVLNCLKIYFCLF